MGEKLHILDGCIKENNLMQIILELHDMNTCSIHVRFDPTIKNNEEVIIKYLRDSGLNVYPGMFKIDTAIENHLKK